MKKQFTSAIVSILAAAVMMAGCGSTADSTKDTGAAQTDSQAQTTTTVAAANESSQAETTTQTEEESKPESSQPETTTTAEQTTPQPETTTQAQTTTKAVTTTTAKAQNNEVLLKKEAPKKTGKISDTFKKYKSVTLSGNSKDRYVTKDFCYIESDKYVLLLEKDLSIPGDFKKNIDAIINSLEKHTGLSYCPDSYDYTKTIDFSSNLYGFNPWEGMDFGKKIPIELIIDRKDEGLICCACDQFVTLDLNELYTDEFWNSVPSYRDNTDWRRFSFVEYHSIAHELTHVLTSRAASLPKIITEGSADYYAKKVCEELASRKGMSKDIKKSLEVYEMIQWELPEKITAANAEKIFLGDYSEIESADRGAEYRLGKEFCTYLEKNYGKDFMTRYINAVNSDPQLRNASRGADGFSSEIMHKHNEILKKLFGKDVFTKFGRDYQKYV